MKIIDLLNKIANGEENDLQTEFVFGKEVYNFYKFNNESGYCLDGWLLNQEIKITKSLNDEGEYMKVGDYVRYKYENCIYIGKIKFISEVMGFEETLQLDIDTCMEEILKEDIIKSSPNIIDLIEVGDYVNGDRVKALKGDIESHKINNEDDVVYTEYINDYDEWCGFEEDEIKSIVTKEQFKSMEYKINKE